MRRRLLGAFTLPVAGAAMILALGGTGCSRNDHDDDGDRSVTTYEGTLTGTGSTSGTIAVTITDENTATGMLATNDSVSGSFHLVGVGTMNLSGTFTEPTGPLSVSGGGYTFTGGLAGGVLSGTWIGPGTNGTFAALVAANSSSVTAFCGTFDGNDSGAWNVAQSGMTLTGSFTGTAGSGSLSGTLVGSSVGLNFSGGTAQGTLNGTSMSGTWSGSAGSGTWQASTGGCQ